MTNEEIFTLMDRFQRSDLQSLKLSQEGFSIELCRATPAPAPVFAAPAPVFAAPAAPAAPAAAPATAQEEAPAVTAPLVGTFYASAGPEEAPFVSVGDTVKKGQVLGIVEAMKLMNEIESEADGVVKAIYVENEQMVEYGQSLFLIG